MIVNLFTSVLVVGSLSVFIGILLGWLDKRYMKRDTNLVDAIEALLPLTQCAQCGYPGCRPYAQAIADGAAINQCPPGGSNTIESLAKLLGKSTRPLNENFGQHKTAQLAFIEEANCIGCTLCIPACPVDAIIGAPQLMHTVIEVHCTGCELCLEPCPVDCISMLDTVLDSRQLKL